MSSIIQKIVELTLSNWRVLYAEKGSDLSLTGITVNATTSENPAGPVRGIEFNLKSGNFANLSFDDLTFTGFDAAHAGSTEYDPQLSIHMNAGATVSNVTVNDVTASQGAGASGAGAIVVEQTCRSK